MHWSALLVLFLAPLVLMAIRLGMNPTSTTFSVCVGECFGLVLLSLGAAWIAFYMFGRSRIAASIVLILLNIGLVSELVRMAHARLLATTSTVVAPGGQIAVDRIFEFFGRFSMNGPTGLRQSVNQPDHLHFGIYDSVTRTNPLNIDVAYLHLPGDLPFSALRDDYSTGLQQKLGFRVPLEWHEQPGVPGLHVSQPMPCVFKESGNKDLTVINRFCVLDLGRGGFAQILFTIGDCEDKDVPTYIELTDRMLATIKLLPAKPATAPAP